MTGAGCSGRCPSPTQTHIEGRPTLAQGMRKQSFTARCGKPSRQTQEPRPASVRGHAQVVPSSAPPASRRQGSTLFKTAKICGLGELLCSVMVRLWWFVLIVSLAPLKLAPKPKPKMLMPALTPHWVDTLL